MSSTSTYGLFSPTGGLYYHFKALRYSGLWQDFKKSLDEWLETWEINRDRILLIGPSGGYTLPLKWLRTFKNILGVEQDPLARRIFEFRVRHNPITWLNTSDRLICFESIGCLEQLLRDYEETPVLFCNILGQAGLLSCNRGVLDPQVSLWKSKLSEILSQRRFASYHDIYSTNLDFELRPHPSEIIWPSNSHVTDHQISDLFSQFKKKSLLKWQLHPRAFHLIETVAQ